MHHPDDGAASRKRLHEGGQTGRGSRTVLCEEAAAVGETLAREQGPGGGRSPQLALRRARHGEVVGGRRVPRREGVRLRPTPPRRSRSTPGGSGSANRTPRGSRAVATTGRPAACAARAWTERGPQTNASRRRGRPASSHTTCSPTVQAAPRNTGVSQCAGRSTSSRPPALEVVLLDEQGRGLGHPVGVRDDRQLHPLAGGQVVERDQRSPGIVPQLPVEDCAERGQAGRAPGQPRQARPTPDGLASPLMSESFWAVVPAGGAGTRLWPLSRRAAPKFLHDLSGSGRTMIQATVDRLAPLAGDRFLVVTGAAHLDAVTAQLPERRPAVAGRRAVPARLDGRHRLGRGAARAARPRRGHGLLRRRPRRRRPGRPSATCVRLAVEVARDDWLVTIGIVPTHPATGFGYIEVGDPLPGHAGAGGGPGVRGEAGRRGGRGVRRLRCATGGTPGCSWSARRCCSTCSRTPTRISPPRCAAWPPRPDTLAEVWPTLPRIAIDHAVAEPAAAAGRVAVVPGSFGWDDIGDFASLASLLPVPDDRAGRPRGREPGARRRRHRPGGARAAAGWSPWSASTTWSSSTPATPSWSPRGRAPRT